MTFLLLVPVAFINIKQKTKALVRLFPFVVVDSIAGIADDAGRVHLVTLWHWHMGTVTLLYHCNITTSLSSSRCPKRLLTHSAARGRTQQPAGAECISGGTLYTLKTPTGHTLTCI